MKTRDYQTLQLDTNKSKGTALLLLHCVMRKESMKCLINLKKKLVA